MASAAQCEEAGSRYFGKLTNVAFILHSPAIRCRSTARLVFQEHCRSINGNSPIVPVQRLCTFGPPAWRGPAQPPHRRGVCVRAGGRGTDPPNAKNFRASAPEFAAAVATCEAAFDKLGYKSLRAYYADPAVKAALRVYAVHAWREVLQILEPRLRQSQRDFDPVQVLIFGHAVFTQAMAAFVAEQRACPAEQQAALLDVVLGEVDVITIARRSCTHVKTH